MKKPLIEGWPYVEVAKQYREFQELFGKEPKVMWVGLDLWVLLSCSFQKRAYVYGNTPVLLDMLGIVAGRDFMFSW